MMRAVRWVDLVRDDALACEPVGDALDALPGEPPRPRDLGDGPRAVLDGGEDSPAGARIRTVRPNAHTPTAVARARS
jgi:hypothetical protein